MTTLQHNSRVAYQRRDRDNNAVGAPLLGSVERVTKTAVYFKNDATGKTYGAPKDRVYPLPPALDKSGFKRISAIDYEAKTTAGTVWTISKICPQVRGVDEWSVREDNNWHSYFSTLLTAQNYVALQQLVNGEVVG
jgi:hypothetical protein